MAMGNPKNAVSKGKFEIHPYFWWNNLDYHNLDQLRASEIWPMLFYDTYVPIFSIFEVLLYMQHRLHLTKIKTFLAFLIERIKFSFGL